MRKLICRSRELCFLPNLYFRSTLHHALDLRSSHSLCSAILVILCSTTLGFRPVTLVEDTRLNLGSALACHPSASRLAEARRSQG